MALEEGETHRFEYAILPYKTSDRPAFARIALEFNTPPIVCRAPEAPAENAKHAEPPAIFAGLSVSAPEICCSAIFADGGSVVVRLWNSTADSIVTDIAAPSDWRLALVGNALLEDSVESVADNGKPRIQFTPFEIKTLLFNVD